MTQAQKKLDHDWPLLSALMASCCSLIAFATHFSRQAIFWVRVNVWSQLMWGYFKIYGGTCFYYMPLRYSMPCSVKPLPYMRLLNWRFGCVKNVSQRLLISIQKFYQFLQVFSHRFAEYTHSYYHVNNFGYLNLNNHGYIFKP